MIKVVDAIWEMKNLKQKSTEITVGDDDVNVIENVLLKLKKDIEYVVIKTPVTNINAINFLINKFKFKFIEMQIELSVSRVPRNMLSNITSDNRKYNLENVKTQDKIDIIKSEINQGIFTTDRIALDHLYGEKIANKRYANWLQDAFAKGNIVYNILYNDEKVGFCLLDKTKTHIILWGLFKKFQHKKLGKVLVESVTQEALSVNNKAFTAVSSNNLGILKLTSECGYVIENIKCVFVKHYL